MSTIRRQLRRRDAGQTTMPFVILGIFVLLLLAWKAVVPLASNNDKLSSTQTAAEAAALAGAQRIQDYGILDLLRDVRHVSDIRDASCSMGRSDAGDLAAQNDATLLSYCYDWRDDRVDVRVRSSHAADGGNRPAATASAQVRFPLSQCGFDEMPEQPEPPEPTEPPDPDDPPPTPPPPVDLPVDLHCGPFTFVFMVDGETGDLRLTGWHDLDDLDEPRLVR